MEQQTDIEDTELKVSKKLSLCTPSQSISTLLPLLIQASRSVEGVDPCSSNVCAPRTSSALSSESPDPVGNRMVKRQREVLRCSGSDCSKKVSLTGFRCRCGFVFCPEHRYSDRHDCCYDYKAAGREAIAKQNPVVRAAKILRI